MIFGSVAHLSVSSNRAERVLIVTHGLTIRCFVMRFLHLTVKDFDTIELNEAFAAQALPCASELGFPLEKVNVNGGAIALGHPVGVSGLRLALTALFELKRRSAERALISACVGGGQGVAMILERK